MRAKLLLAIALLFAAGAQAQEKTPIAQAELLVDAPSLAPGDTAWAGIRFTLPEHWHIYWKNPGDSGIPTTYKITVPEGMTAGEIAWPAPERVEMSGMVNYGYSNEVVLPVPLTVNADNGENDITVSGDLTIKADWLVCKDICIPESATFTVPLPHTDDAARTALAEARKKVPTPLMAKARYAAADDGVALIVPLSPAWKKPVSADFTPEQDGIIPNVHTVDMEYGKGNLTLRLPRASAEPPTVWSGVLSLKWANGEEATYQLTAERQDHIAGKLPVLPILLALAFLGGLLLNIMPCVLPILSLKALALVKKASAEPKVARKQAFAYTLGVVSFFVGIAAVMIGLKLSGEAVGWGFQLQSPAIVAVLALLMLGVSLNLFGLFHLPPVLGRIMVEGDGLRGTFLTGALAVAVATPCTAPFMASAIGATLTLPIVPSLLIFAAMGLGMASPFLLIGLWPPARRLLPKPGHWMHRFRQILAVPMLATALWLGYVLLQLLHPTPMAHAANYTIVEPVPYSAERLAELRAAERPVFVDATASWCLTCKVNERVALRPEEVQKYFVKHDVTLMIADWTARDEAIAEYLATFGRNGVPIYVFYPPGDVPVILPQVLTPSLVLNTLGASLGDAQ